MSYCGFVLVEGSGMRRLCLRVGQGIDPQGSLAGLKACLKKRATDTSGSLEESEVENW